MNEIKDVFELTDVLKPRMKINIYVCALVDFIVPVPRSNGR